MEGVGVLAVLVFVTGRGVACWVDDFELNDICGRW